MFKHLALCRWGGEGLTCGICWFLWWWYSHHSECQATNRMSLNTGLGRDATCSRHQPPPAHHHSNPHTKSSTLSFLSLTLFPFLDEGGGQSWKHNQTTEADRGSTWHFGSRGGCVDFYYFKSSDFFLQCEISLHVLLQCNFKNFWGREAVIIQWIRRLPPSG